MHRMTINKNFNVAATALFIFCTVVILFTPIFGHQFGYSNDYTVFEYNNHNCCLGFPETTHLFAIGRPLQAILLNVQLMFVSDIQSLQLMRLFIVLMIGIVATLFFLYLQSNLNIGRYSAALLSVLTFTLPSMTITSFWICQSIPGILPLFFVLLAHFWMQKRNSSDHNKALIITAVFSLIFFSLLIYPPATFFFLTLTFIKFVFGTKDLRQARFSDIAAEVIILVAACIFYFLSIKFIFKPLLLMSNFGGGDFQSIYNNIDTNLPAYKLSLSFDFASKVERMYDLFILDFSAWFPPLTLSLVNLLAFVFILILTWASLYTPYLKYLRISSKIILGLAVSITIPFLTALPVLAGGDYPIQYRVIFASMATIPVAIVFAIDRAMLAGKSWAAFIPILVASAGFILAAEISSYQRLALIVSRLSAEYRHVLDTVSRENFEDTREIRIPPMPPPDPSGFFYRDFIYSVVNSITPGMVYAATRMSGQNIDDYHIVFDPLGPRYHANISEGITFNRDGYPSFVSSYKGISGKEAWGRWTDSEEVVIEFAKSLPKNFTLKINAGASLVLVNKPVKIIVGKTQLETKFSKQEPTEVVLNVSTDGNAKSIVFKFPNLMPVEHGLNADPRHLGLALIKLQIDL